MATIVGGDSSGEMDVTTVHREGGKDPLEAKARDQHSYIAKILRVRPSRTK